MSTQPEALRLVNNRHNAHMLTWQANACAELRRLHEVNQELLGALLDLQRQYKYVTEFMDWGKARAAIAKATGSAA